MACSCKTPTRQQPEKGQTPIRDCVRQEDRAATLATAPHLDELPVVFQLFLKRLHLLAEVFGVALMLLCCFQALCLLLFQLSLHGLESLRQQACVPLCLPLQVYPVLGQTIRLCQQSLDKKKNEIKIK